MSSVLRILVQYKLFVVSPVASATAHSKFPFRISDYTSASLDLRLRFHKPMNARQERVFPPIDGSITIPEVLDFHWEHNAELPSFIFSRDGSDELSEISYTEFGRACDRAAYALRPQPSGEERPVVALIALADTITYQAITIGMMRARLIVCYLLRWFYLLTLCMLLAIPDLPT